MIISSATQRAVNLRPILLIFLVCVSTVHADDNPPRSAPLSWLRAKGMYLVDAEGRKVVLQGFNLDGAFTVEIWQSAFDKNRSDTQFPEIKDERTLWDVLTMRFGPEKTADLRHVWRTAWASGKDIERLTALGCNVVRIPFWHRLLEDDSQPPHLLPEGIKLLDGLVAACAANHVYAILDMHGVPGCQSKEHHTGECDRNELWHSEKYRRQMATLWAAIARHYVDRPEVAGFDLMNEPMGAPDWKTLTSVDTEMIHAIRAVDSRHVIFIEDGYKGADSFPASPRKLGWTNVAYSFHHYRFDAHSPEAHYASIRDDLPKWREKQKKWDVPLFIGEFSTIGRDAGGEKTMQAYFNAFTGYGWSWTAWEYKKLSDRDGRGDIWGLYTNVSPWDRPNPYKDSFEELRRKFDRYDTSNLVLQAAFGEAVKSATARGHTDHHP